MRLDRLHPGAKRTHVCPNEACPPVICPPVICSPVICLPMICLVDLIKSLGADAPSRLLDWHSRGELKAHGEGLLECIELALKHEVFTQKAHGTNWHYARAALRVMKEELSIEVELEVESTYSIFDNLVVGV